MPSAALRNKHNAVFGSLWFASSTFRALAASSSQRACYVAAGLEYRAPEFVVPCIDTDLHSPCCILGDTCLAGNACYNHATFVTYMYGCTDETYIDDSCPYKCGWDIAKSPWTALLYCTDPSINNTWVCNSPESCQCEWSPNPELQGVPMMSCKYMGPKARVALYAPNLLEPYLSLPQVLGESTGYFSWTTQDGSSRIISTVISGYTPKSIGPSATYRAPSTPVTLFITYPSGRAIVTSITRLGASSNAIDQTANPTFATPPSLSQISSATATQASGSIPETPCWWLLNFAPILLMAWTAGQDVLDCGDLTSMKP